MRSIKRRLHLGLAVSLVLSLALLGVVIGVLLTSLAEDFVLSRLAHDGESLLEVLQVDAGDQTLSITPGRVGAIYRRALSGHYWVVLGPPNSQGDPGQRLRSRSLWDEHLVAQRQPQGSEGHDYQNGPLEQWLLVWSGGFLKQGVEVTIVVAEDLSPLLQSYRHLGWAFVGLSVGVLLVLLLVQGRLVTLGFRPAEHTRRQLQQLQQGELQALDTDVPDELRPLVIEVNHLLSLFEERLQRSRNAVGNLAHGLKTPLTVLRGLAKHAEQQPVCEVDADTATEIERQTAKIHHLLERELKRARLAGNGVPGQRFEPAAELPGLVSVLEKVHGAREIRFDCSAPDGVGFHFDRDDMLELLGNLLDNAGKWADERVRCRIEGRACQLLLTVEDDGPGCSDEELQQLTGRGVRIDEGMPGHGLGLAIVNDIVSDYHGSLAFSRSEALAGLKVTVALTTECGVELSS